MNVADKALCQELYELSGWRFDTGYSWFGNVLQSDITDRDCPAYDLGFLLRKLPRQLVHPDTRKITIIKITSYELDGSGFMPYWIASYDKRGSQERYRCSAGTVEDAAAKLAIELFKQGILTSEDKS